MYGKKEKPEGCGEVIVYQTEDGLTRLEVKFEGETVWLTQMQMAELFQTTKQNISFHINNCFKEGELKKEEVVKEYLTTASDGKRYKTSYYNLDIIISVGYRVKSIAGTRFRQWATVHLKEYMIKGFTMDDERLKGNGGGNYWKEAMEKANAEYKKFQEKTLSPIEEEYLQSIKEVEKEAKKHAKE